MRKSSTYAAFMSRVVGKETTGETGRLTLCRHRLATALPSRHRQEQDSEVGGEISLLPEITAELNASTILRGEPLEVPPVSALDLLTMILLWGSDS